jgi:hypothetical protein
MFEFLDSNGVPSGERDIWYKDESELESFSSITGTHSGKPERGQSKPERGQSLPLVATILYTVPKTSSFEELEAEFEHQARTFVSLCLDSRQF